MLLNMLLVKTKIGVSKVHGIGLFADQFIPKGTITWQYHPLFDTAFSEEEIAKLSPPSKREFFHFAYFDKELNKYVLCFDSQRFINHSKKKPNVHSAVHQDVAARDIRSNEEILCDYNKYDDGYFMRHGIKEEHINDPD